MVELTLLFLCHYLADYTPLSTRWMLNAKRIGNPIFPIFIHSCVHGVLMFSVLIFFASLPLAIGFMLFEIITHTIIDTIKGKMNVWLPLVSNPINKSHWIIFGLDQLLHQVIILIIYFNLI